ncbi:MAG: TIGR01841 family phasin [Acetobacteraceae bacterium]
MGLEAFKPGRQRNVRSSSTMSIRAKSSDPMSEAQTAVQSGFEQTVSAMKDGIGRENQGFEKTQEQVKENMDKVMKTAEELMAFNQGNFEAVVTSGKIWSAGMQDLTQQAVASAQASFDETLATYRALAAVKSVREVVDLTTNLARSAVEKALSDAGRISNASVKLTEQAFAPITQRVALAMEKFAKTA